MRLDVILRIASKILIPFMLVFALYVHFHGDFSAGGGFQAGVIVAAAVIFHALVFGLYPTQKIVPPRLAELMMPLGVFIFAGVGVISLMLGENFLGYDVLAHNDHPGEPNYHGQERGVLWGGSRCSDHRGGYHDFYFLCLCRTGAHLSLIHI